MEVKIHQALYGYADGHNLIASSLRIPSKAHRSMLLLSDMSGATMIPKFETYITGYPLSEIDKYVIARTWYAHEMDRPGCVWTHALLIDFDDMESIRDVRRLLALFRRPNSSEEKERYSRTLSLLETSGDTSRNAESTVASSLVLSVVGGIYGSDCGVTIKYSACFYG